MKPVRGFVSLGPFLFAAIGCAILGGVRSYAGWGGEPHRMPRPDATPTVAVSSDAGLYIRQRGLLVLNDGNTWQQLNIAGPPVPQLSIYTERADGTRKTRLTGPGNAFPSWTPDGKIIFVSDRSGSPQIWIMEADGSNPRQIGNLNLNGHLLRPQLGKNGLIAFLADDGVWIMQQDGSGLKQLVPHGSSPSLALSGTWLTYTLPGGLKPIPDAHNEIFRINPDGTGNKQLTFADDADYQDANASAISPDETMIAIYTGTESKPGNSGLTEYHNIALIGPDGGTKRLLTTCRPVMTMQALQHLSHDQCVASDDPSWSPDSKWVVYGRASSGETETWMVDTNGQNAQELYHGALGYGIFRLKLDSGAE